MEDWFHQMSNPRKIKNLLTLLTNLLTYICVHVTGKNDSSGKTKIWIISAAVYVSYFDL